MPRRIRPFLQTTTAPDILAGLRALKRETGEKQAAVTERALRVELARVIALLPPEKRARVEAAMGVEAAA